MKKELPKIIKLKGKSNQIRESGCCFRSCGGVPLIQQDQPKIKILNKNSRIKRKLLKIK